MGLSAESETDVVPSPSSASLEHVAGGRCVSLGSGSVESDEVPRGRKPGSDRVEASVHPVASQVEEVSSHHRATGAMHTSACRAHGRLCRRRDACPSPRAGCENAMRNAMGLAVPDEVHARGEEVAVILLHAAVGGEPGEGNGGGQREAPERVRGSRTSRGARHRGISARGVRSRDAGGVARPALTHRKCGSWDPGHHGSTGSWGTACS